MRLQAHSSHLASVLGRYCWVCKVKVQAGVPGWGRASHSDRTPKATAPAGTFINQNAKYVGPNPYEHLTSVVWANGDTARGKDQTQCADCEKHCGRPVDREFKWGDDPYGYVTKTLLN